MDADNEESQEAIDYMFLRYQFREHNFTGGRQWQALSAAGVVHSYPRYCFGDYVFDNAIELQTALDRFSVGSRVSIWESAKDDNETTMEDEKYEATMRDLRRDVCCRLYVITKGAAVDDKEDDNSTVQEAAKKQITGGVRSSSRRRKETHPESTTAALQSSDLYLRKTRQKKSSKPSKTTPVEAVTELDSFVFPTLQECRALTQGFDMSHAEQIEEQHSVKDFDAWKLALATGHYHLLFYGHGSKHEILQSFCKTVLPECCVLEIQGGDPQASVAGILELLELHAPSESDSCAPMILVIHSLDFLLQREKKREKALEQLVAQTKACLIGAVNCIDPPVLNEESNSPCRRRLLYIPVHTHRPVELSDTGDAATASRPAARQRRSADRLWAVLHNLAPRYAEVLQVLARLQLATTATSWTLYKDFLSACRDKCLIDKDGKLRGLLQELRDHGMLEMRREEAGAESVSIPFDPSTLRDILKYEPREGR